MIPEPTKITFEHHEMKYSAELNWDADMTTILTAFAGLLRASGFHEETIKEFIKLEDE